MSLSAAKAAPTWFPRTAGPEIWFWPPFYESTDVRYAGEPESSAAFRDHDLWGPAVARCDVIGHYVNPARQISTGTDGYLARLASLANTYKKPTVMAVGGPYGLQSYPGGVASATQDINTSLAYFAAQGGDVANSILRMDHPMQRVLESTAASASNAISSVSVASPGVVTTSAAHGYSTNDVVLISGTTTTPTINGARTVTVTGSTTFTVGVNTTVGQGSPAGTAGKTLAQAVDETVLYMQTIHATYPNIRIGMVSQITRWDYDGLGTYGAGLYGWDFGVALDALMADIVTAGETLDHLHADITYEYLNDIVDTGSDVDHWATRLKKVQDKAISHGLDFGLTTASSFGGGGEDGSGTFPGAPFAGSNEAFEKWTLVYAEQLKGLVQAGKLTALDHVVIQSFFQYPNDLAPATTAYTFCDTFLKVRELFV